MKIRLVRGLPGSGKSTFAAKVAAAGNFDHFEADQLFTDQNGEYNFDPEFIGEAHAMCYNGCKAALERGENVIISNTFTMCWEFDNYLGLAKEFNCDLEITECTGQYGSVHGVPEEAIVAMKNRYEEQWAVEAHCEKRLGRPITYIVM